MAVREEKLELKLSVKHGESKKQVFTGFNLSATDSGLMAFGQALDGLVDGSVSDVAKIEESKLIYE